MAITTRRTRITARIFLPLLIYETAIFVSGNFLA